ncbi:glutathione S-transferase [Altererythrobacter sp. MF3-039]|uniref:glutathione S-transferase n=1 Tax=Altererythrobacter sp. MF3-039 TaxID=3252901 RepID=UPI00390C659A
MTHPPILYSFRRCPYAMRARLALWIAGIDMILREVKLADKPPALLEISPKGTVPVLISADGPLLDESIDIMRWALGRNDPEGWLEGDDRELLELIDGPFKHHLDRYKYSTRYDTEPLEHRAAALKILRELDARLEPHGQLCGETRTLADMASFTFIRQFANHDRAWFDALDLPHLHTWLDGHLKSDIFKAIMPKFAPWKAGDEPLRFGPAQAA